MAREAGHRPRGTGTRRVDRRSHAGARGLLAPRRGTAPTWAEPQALGRPATARGQARRAGSRAGRPAYPPLRTRGREESFCSAHQAGQWIWRRGRRRWRRLAARRRSARWRPSWRGWRRRRKGRRRNLKERRHRVHVGAGRRWAALERRRRRRRRRTGGSGRRRGRPGWSGPGCGGRPAQERADAVPGARAEEGASPEGQGFRRRSQARRPAGGGQSGQRTGEGSGQGEGARPGGLAHQLLVAGLRGAVAVGVHAVRTGPAVEGGKAAQVQGQEVSAGREAGGPGRPRRREEATRPDQARRSRPRARPRG